MVVGLAAHDRPSAVELLYKHDLCQLVSESLRSQRDSPVGGRDHRWRQPIGPANRKDRAPDPVRTPLVEQIRPTLGAQRLRPWCERHQPVARSNRSALEKPLTLLIQRLRAGSFRRLDVLSSNSTVALDSSYVLGHSRSRPIAPEFVNGDDFDFHVLLADRGFDLSNENRVALLRGIGLGVGERMMEATTFVTSARRFHD